MFSPLSMFSESLQLVIVMILKQKVTIKYKLIKRCWLEVEYHS